jgi:hypothetical protein
MALVQRTLIVFCHPVINYSEQPKEMILPSRVCPCLVVKLYMTYQEEDEPRPVRYVATLSSTMPCMTSLPASYRHSCTASPAKTKPMM